MDLQQSAALPTNKRQPTASKKRAGANTLQTNGGQSSQPNTPSPVKRRKKGEGQVFTNCDAYCWLCHREGKVFKCSACPRVYHTRCLGVDFIQAEEWVCAECKVVLNAENIDTRSRAMKMISFDQLCSLLRFALNRMKNAGDEAFLKPVSLEEFPSYADFVYQPMDLSTLEKNIRNKMYGCTESLLSDTKWILHNCIIFNGYQHRLTSSAKSIVKVCRFEMNEIEVCPYCYLNSYTSKDNWFCDPCREPHPLVWAKLKGFPYWPAKAMQVIDNNVDVRFFGAHDRAWIPVNQCFLLCRDIPTATKNKKKGSFEQSMEELELHIQRLRDRFGPFQYAPFRTPLNPDDLASHIKTFLPQYGKEMEQVVIELQTERIRIENTARNSVEKSVELSDQVKPNEILTLQNPGTDSLAGPELGIKKVESAIDLLREHSADKSDDEVDEEKVDEEKVEPKTEINVTTPTDDKEEVGNNRSSETCEVSSTTQMNDLEQVKISSPKKDSAFAQKLDRTIESCKAKLGIDEIEDEVLPADESSDEENGKQLEGSSSLSLSVEHNDDTNDNVNDSKKIPKYLERENVADNQEIERTDLDMECSDDGDLIIDLKADEKNKPGGPFKVSVYGVPPKNSRWKGNPDPVEEKKSRKTRSRSATLETARQKPVMASTLQTNNSGNETAYGSSTSFTHTLPMSMSAMQPHTLVTTKGMAQMAPPSSPGPGCDMNKYSRKMMDFMRGTVEEMFRDMASSGNLEAKVKTLQLEIEKLQWRHQQELAEIKHNADLILLEMRASMESEKLRALAELKRQCEIEKQKAIDDTKKKQWCANCGKDAIFYCCWNTSYCDFSCQSAHWPQHMAACTQSQGTSENEEAAKGAIGGVSCNAPLSTSSLNSAKLLSPPNQMQRVSQCSDGRNSSVNRRDDAQDSWSRKLQDDANANYKRQHEDEQREREKQRLQIQIGPTGTLGNQYPNNLGPSVQYIPSNAVQVIPQTSSLANSSALQVQYVGNHPPNSPQGLSLTSPVTTTSSFTPLSVSSAFPLQQNLAHQSSNRSTTQTLQRSLQMSNPTYIMQPNSLYGASGSQASPPDTSHSYVRGPYIPGKPYHAQ